MSKEEETIPKGRLSRLGKLTNPRFHQSILLVSIFAAIIALPLFMLVYKYIPTLYFYNYKIDHFLTFIAVYIPVYFFVKRFRVVVYGSAIVGLVFLTVTNFWGSYGLDDLYQDYASFLYTLKEGSGKKALRSGVSHFERKTALLAAVNYNDEDVRNYAANAAVVHFDEFSGLGNRKILQSFSIFKEIRKRWRYVFDPKNEDYYASASETISQLEKDGKFKGDCDDYSILLAACVKAIGCEVKMVRTVTVNEDGQKVGHLYPEVKVGKFSDLERITYLVKQVLFQEEAEGKQLFYNVDAEGDVWLNFDYNDFYPGGLYQSDERLSELAI